MSSPKVRLALVSSFAALMEMSPDGTPAAIDAADLQPAFQLAIAKLAGAPDLSLATVDAAFAANQPPPVVVPGVPVLDPIFAGTDAAPPNVALVGSAVAGPNAALPCTIQFLFDVAGKPAPVVVAIPNVLAPVAILTAAMSAAGVPLPAGA